MLGRFVVNVMIFSNERVDSLAEPSYTSGIYLGVCWKLLLLPFLQAS